MLSSMDFSRIRVHPLLFRIHHWSCDHMCSAFWFDKQSDVIKIVDVWSRSQPPRLSLNSRSTCFSNNYLDLSEVTTEVEKRCVPTAMKSG